MNWIISIEVYIKFSSFSSFLVLSNNFNIYLYLYIYITLFIYLISTNYNFNNLLLNEYFIENIPVEKGTTIFGVIYNYMIGSIFIYGYSNNSNINIHPCKVYSMEKQYECIVKYKCIIETFFVYELMYNYTNKPLLIYIRSRKINVQYSFKHNTRNTVCITKMINYTASNYIIQMIESYRYFGITNFVIYYTSSSSYILQILKYYEKINILTLINWNYSYETTFMKKYDYGQKWKYNDCYYRNAGNNGLIVFTDLDEIIWPVSNKKITGILKGYDEMKSDVYVFKTKIYLKQYCSVNNRQYDRFIHFVNDFDMFKIHNACIYPNKYLRKYVVNNYNSLKVINIHDIIRSAKHVKISYLSETFGYIRHSRIVRADLYRNCGNWKNYYDSKELIKLLSIKVNFVRKSIKEV